MDVQQHTPRPTFSMLMLSNCSLRSAMTALWDWRVWSDATRLLSRSCLTSSNDVTSFSSRHTSSSRCCRSDCHYKQTLSLHFVSREKKQKKKPQLYNVVRYISVFGCFLPASTNKQTANTHAAPPTPLYLYTASDLPLRCFFVLCLP